MIIHDREGVNSERNEKSDSEISKSCEQIDLPGQTVAESRHRTLSLSRLAWQAERVSRGRVVVLLHNDALAGDNFRKD